MNNQTLTTQPITAETCPERLYVASLSSWSLSDPQPEVIVNSYGVIHVNKTFTSVIREDGTQTLIRTELIGTTMFYSEAEALARLAHAIEVHIHSLKLATASREYTLAQIQQQVRRA